MLYRATGNILLCLPSRGPAPTMLSRLVDRVRPDAPEPARPHWTPRWTADAYRQREERCLEFDPYTVARAFRIWNVRRFGPWVEFSWRRLLA